MNYWNRNPLPPQRIEEPMQVMIVASDPDEEEPLGSYVTSNRVEITEWILYFLATYPGAQVIVEQTG